MRWEKTMNKTFTNYQLIALLKEIIHNKGYIELFYSTKNGKDIGIRILEYIVNVQESHGNIECSTEDDFIIDIVIPKDNRKFINCKIVHEQYEEPDYDKMTTDEAEFYLMNDGMPEEKEKIKIQDSFKIYINDININVNISEKIFYEIIDNIDKYTEKLLEQSNKDQYVDIDIEGFWESIDNMLEK